ncbi:uncharacterized protein [Macrobrachium rosenbergii]|uniref:uncharacterized protein n=1 Tax=Macrobrachium rosenbergii TaxID=79674 RepID=UPI0034D610CD
MLVLQKDCEMVNLRSLDDPLSLTLEDTLLVSIFPSEVKWDATAQVTDSSGTQCQLVLRRDVSDRYEGIQCPGANGVTTRKNMQVSGVWMDFHIDVEKCFSKENLCASQMRVTLGQQLPIDFYNPTWKKAPLQPPLTLTWNHRTQADLVFGCERAVCVQNSTTLVAPITFRRRSFFLKPGDSLQGFSLLLKPLVVESYDVVYVDMTGVALPEGNWVEVQLENDTPFKKITVDGRLVLILTKYKDEFQIRIQSVQLQGTGMLTWCDPRSSGVPDLSSSQHHIKSVVIGLLVLIIILLTGVFIYFWNKSLRVPQTSKDPDLAKQPNSGGSTSRPRGTPPMSPVDEEFIYESEPGRQVYESIRDHSYLSMHGGQSYVSMHPPSLYDDVDGGNGNGSGSKGTKEDLYINVY